VHKLLLVIDDDPVNRAILERVLPLLQTVAGLADRA